jgi:hypothetical protein
MILFIRFAAISSGMSSLTYWLPITASKFILFKRCKRFSSETPHLLLCGEQNTLLSPEVCCGRDGRAGRLHSVRSRNRKTWRFNEGVREEKSLPPLPGPRYESGWVPCENRIPRRNACSVGKVHPCGLCPNADRRFCRWQTGGSFLLPSWQKLVRSSSPNTASRSYSRRIDGGPRFLILGYFSTSTALAAGIRARHFST